MAFRVLVVKGGSQPGHRPRAQWHFIYVDTRSSSEVGLLNLCGKRSKTEVTEGAKVFMAGPRTALTVGRVMYVTQLAVTWQMCGTLYHTRYEVALHTPAAVSGRGGGLVI